jgi:pyrroloquinoline quinone biosynthesis protein D
MSTLKRDPSVNWRTESHREERAREVLSDPDREEEDREVSGLGTVTLLSGGVMHQLNYLGGEIWKLCDGNRDREQVLESLMELFDADRNTVKKDLDTFLDGMIEKGLIHEEG